MSAPLPYGLPERTTHAICAVLTRIAEVDKAVLYGSRAKGNYKPGSDIDLTLYGPQLTARLCSAIADEIDELLLPYSVDLSVFADLNHTELQAHIERVGLVFYQRAGSV